MPYKDGGCYGHLKKKTYVVLTKNVSDRTSKLE
jgi:hypothetical protein